MASMDLTDPSNLQKDEITSAFVDDPFLAAQAKTIEASHNMLTDMMQHENGAIEWSHKHNSFFEMAKNGLMIFTNQRIPDPARWNKTIPVPCPPSVIHGHAIATTDTHKFLGVILDKNL